MHILIITARPAQHNTIVSSLREVPRLLLLSQPVDVVRQVIPVNLHAGLLVGELVHLAPQLPHLVLVQISHAGRALAPQLLQLRQQDLVLLLQEADLVDVVGEAVVERLHLRFLVGAVRDELAVYGVGQGEVQVLGGQPGHACAAAEPLGLRCVDVRRGGETEGYPGGAHRAGELAAGVAGPGRDSLPAKHLLVRRMWSWSVRHLASISSHSSSVLLLSRLHQRSAPGKAFPVPLLIYSLLLMQMAQRRLEWHLGSPIRERNTRRSPLRSWLALGRTVTAQ